MAGAPSEGIGKKILELVFELEQLIVEKVFEGQEVFDCFIDQNFAKEKNTHPITQAQAENTARKVKYTMQAAQVTSPYVPEYNQLVSAP